MNVGFIGIGSVGKGMAQRILEVGYDLTVHDLRKEAARHLLEKGAKWSDTPKGVAESCQVVLSSLPGPAEVQEVVYGTNGLLAGWKKGDIYIDMTTNSPTTIRQVAQDAKAKGVSVLDAAVSKLTPDAEAGALTIMVGGDPDCLKAVRKILEAIGNRIFHVGDVGCGNIVKLINNLIGITANEVTAGAFVLGVKAGIDPRQLLEVLKVSTGNNFAVQSYPRTVFQGNFEPFFRLSLALKDLSLALALGKEYGVPLPVVAAVEQRLVEAKAAHLGDKHLDALILPLERLVGVQVRSPE
jgi:2-hydroxymethylglutarate dehydrogenase